MLAQINSVRGVVFLLSLTLLFAGCTPAGPRALLKGKKYLDRGDVADAVTQLKRATTILATNANAWNYYGVALQRAGQPDEAANAYERALQLDHDLVEAHYNLGFLSLEQNKADLAKAEFTTYTLRRPNDPAGWMKLGFAQLKAGESMSAERSFSAVLSLMGDKAAAYNGLGLASVQLGKIREAVEFFTGALQSRADFAPALLNLATVNQEYLHDNRAALANYQAYLALNPRPANYDDVKAIVNTLAQSDVATTVMTPAVVKTPPPETKPKIVIVTAPHPAPPAPRPETPETTPGHETLITAITPTTTANTTAPKITPLPPPMVQTQHVARVVPVTRTNPPSHTTSPAHPTVIATRPNAANNNTNTVANNAPLEVPMPEEQPKSGFWGRMFGGGKPSYNNPKREHEETVTPIPATTEEQPAGTKPEEKPPETQSAPVQNIPRYSYTSPQLPAAGDRRAAEAEFSKARLAEQEENWPDAEQFYQVAADTDPSWFEAQYNTGVIAHRLRNFSVALPRYELALALQPESIDARYNFALALKASGYPVDAADELRKILVLSPDEVRAHLALANLCAQALHDITQAREHYLKVLDLQPNNPQAADIRFWLSANSK